MKALRWSLGLVCLGLALPALAVKERQGAPDVRTMLPDGISSRSVDVTATTPSKAGGVVLEFTHELPGSWQFRMDPRTERFTMIQGSGLPLIPGRGNNLQVKSFAGLKSAEGRIDMQQVEPLVREFVERNRERIGPPTGELVLDPKASIARDRDRLISVYYDWHVGGVRVEGARVFARINSGNITQFGGRYVGPIDLDPTPQIRPGRALKNLFDYSGDADTALVEGEPELLIQPEDGKGDRIVYRLVWKVRYTVPGEIETWEARIDAHSGEIVAFQDVNMYNHTKGGIYLISPFSSTEMTVPMRGVSVFNNGTKTSDGAGIYGYNGGLTNSTLSGVFFDINCLGCTSPTQPLSQKLLGTGLLDFGMGGADQVGNGVSTPSDRNTIFHLNEIRRLALKWVPEVGWLYTPRFTVNTNVGLTCNATFNGSAMNFYRSGGGCNNSGLVADVVNHEWGHGIDSNTQPGDSGTGEGTADVNAMNMSQRSAVGPGFTVSGGPVRNLHWPSSGIGLLTKSRIDSGFCNFLSGGALSVHCVGQVFGQAAWELATVLTPPGSYHTGWRQSERLFYLSLADAGTYDPTDPLNIYEAYIQADDDDGNLANGTPHGGLIFDAFDRHEIATSPVGTSAPCPRPDQPSVSATSSCDAIDLTWTPTGNATRYEIFRAEHRENTAYLPVAVVDGGTTSFTDNEVAPGVQYYYYVMAVDSAECESKVENPRAVTVTDQ
ncbi:hypothetical protein N9971_00840, partial [bacterium]|nr:hypothetical protein [bacterium]